MNHPLVSILIPVYSVEQYIERCARSVFEQTYDNLEFIFVDDCTPDNSIQLLKEVLAQYPHRASKVRIIKHDQNEGLAIARNTAIRNATGVFIYNLDSDDYIETDTIELFVTLQEQTNADVVTGRMYINIEEIDPRYVEPFYQSKDEMLTTIVSDLWHHEFVNRLVRRSLFVEHEIKALPHVNICEDWQMTAKVVYYANTCVTADKYTYHYMKNPNSLVHFNSDWKKEKKAYIQESLALNNLIDFFEGTKYEKYICPFFVRRYSDLLDLGIKHHDKDYFEWCRSLILSISYQYHHAISRQKMTCIKLGYYATSIFLHLHRIKQRLK